LTEDNFGADRHPRPKAGLDNGDRSWQVETIVDGGYLMKVCHTGNPTGSTVGMRFEEAPEDGCSLTGLQAVPQGTQRGFSWCAVFGLIL